MKLSIKKVWFLFLPVLIILFFPLKSILGEISILDVFIFIVFISSMFSFKIYKIHFYLFIIIIFSLISSFVNFNKIENIKYWVRLVEYICVFYITYFYYDEETHVYFNKGILIILISLIFYGIIQKIFPQLINIGNWGPEWKENYIIFNKVRVYSFLDNPLNLVGVLSLFLGYYISNNNRNKFILIVLIYIVLFLTGSKIAIAIILLSITYFIFNIIIKNSINKVYFFVLILTVGIMLLNYKRIKETTVYKRYVNKVERYDSVNQRELVLNSSIEMIKDNPIFGIGAGNFGEIYPFYKKKRASNEESSFTSENMFVDFYLDNGLIPFIIFIYIIIEVFLSYFVYKKEKVLKRLIRAIFFFILVGFVTNLRSVPTFMLFFYFIAIFYKRKNILNARI